MRRFNGKPDRCFYVTYRNGSLGNLFLYDVTSSYLEGEENYFGEYGYSRDKKRGKRQIVIGLFCDGEGYPESVNVYKGKTSDFNL